MSSENLANFVRFWGRSKPNEEAIVGGDAVLTWGQLDTVTNRLANGLQALGIGKGDRVGIVARNCIEYIEIVVAGYKLGAVTVPLNHRLTANELRFMVNHSGCRAIVAHSEFAEVVSQALDGLAEVPGRGEVIRIGLEPGFGRLLGEVRSDDDTDPQVPVGPGDVAYICYTSGTTGLPKGAMLTHGNVLATTYFRNLADDLGQGARLYLPAPLAFTGTLVMLWGVAYAGGGLTVLDTVSDPRRSLEIIQKYQITHFVAVPVIWERMVRDPDFASYDLTSLRTCLTGGATVTSALLQTLWDSGLPVRNSYGLTEASSCSTWQSLKDSQRQPSSVGRSVTHSAIRIIDHTRQDLVDVPVGEIGEIAQKGPEVMLGYWEDPTATAATVVDGWLRTGDIGRLTEDGYLQIVGRLKDMFISGGLNVYPAEIEGVLERLDGVAECAVIGVSDERWGETAAAIVYASADARLEPAAVRDYCRSYLADYKLPRYVVIRDVPLPRNMSGKVLKQELRSEYSNATALGRRLQ